MLSFQAVHCIYKQVTYLVGGYVITSNYFFFIKNNNKILTFLEGYYHKTCYICAPDKMSILSINIPPYILTSSRRKCDSKRLELKKYAIPKNQMPQFNNIINNLVSSV